MKRLLTAVCFSLMCLTPVLAQDSETDQIEYLQSEETEEPVFEKRNFFKTKAGDQIIRISLDGTIPLNFPSITTLFTEDKKLAGGGSGYIGYHYFITDQLAVGGNLGFGFNATIGEHMFHYAPLIATVTYQPSYKRFEFPLSMGIGLAWEAYNGYTYFPGLVIKPSAGVHFRALESWAFGVDLSYMLMPQFAKLYGTGSSNFAGQWLEFDITARYYF